MKCEPTLSIEWPSHGLPTGTYRRLLLSRRRGLARAETLPRMVCSQRQVQIDPEHLGAYRRVVGFGDAESAVPLLFPHAMLGPAHLVMLSHSRFPIGSSGLLHVRNHVLQFESLPAAAPWDVECVLARQRFVERGLEFDFDSTIRIDGRVLWTSISTLLKRSEKYGGTDVSPASELFPRIAGRGTPELHISVPRDIGRQYAKVTGDYNPIHVSHLAAKLFGFKKAVAHGMWTAARAIRELPSSGDAVRLDVAFKGPMFVGSQAKVQCGENHRFDVYCGRNPRPVLVGVLRESIDPGEEMFPTDAELA